MRKLLFVSLFLLPFVLHGATPKLPPEKELKAMVLDSLSAFNKAVQQKNFAKFHEEGISSQLRKQVSLEKLTETFRVFIDRGYDISDIAKSEPAFDTPPAINSDGLIILQGHYPTKPNKVTFKLSYIQDPSAWKLSGIHVVAGPPEEVPSDKQLKAMALASLMAFNEAVKTKSFEKFHGQIAKGWQEQATPEQLLNMFKTFVDQKVDISLIAKLEPAFEPAPAMNSDGFLALSGSYPTKPNKLSFELEYLKENGTWKLVGINLDLKPDADQAEKAADDDQEEAEDDDSGEE